LGVLLEERHELVLPPSPLLRRCRAPVNNVSE
jgi:hypothetical protein